MARLPEPMMKPRGWFQIGWSADVPVGQVVTRACFGESLVVYRSEDGTLRAVDAYCGHMGAHLGVGGTVCGTEIQCPFHGWRWNGEGRNTLIPYQDRPNGAVRMRTWPIVERNDVLYIWHDRDGGEPAWEIPDAFEVLGDDIAGRRYHPSHPDGEIRHGRRTLDPYVVLDNTADPAHFAFVHETPSIPIVVSSVADDHHYRVRLGWGRSWQEDPENGRGDLLDIVQVGVGLSYTAFGNPRGRWVIILLATTPIDDETSELFQTVWLEEAPGDEEPGQFRQRIHDATFQLPRDIEIWENQRYVDSPAWAAGEVRGFTALRRWAATFYEPLV